MKRIVLLIIIFVSVPKIFSQQIMVGSGSYNLTFPPSPFPAVYGGSASTNQYELTGGDWYFNPVSPKTVAGFTQMPQTNDWWSSAIWNYNSTTNDFNSPYSYVMYPHPQWIRAHYYGLDMCVEESPQITNGTGGDFYYYVQPDLNVIVDGMNVPQSTGTQVKSYGDWTATFRWDDGTNSLEATSGHGLPFTYFTKSGGDIVIRATGAISFFAFSANYIGVNIWNTNYGIYFPTGTLINGNPVTSYSVGSPPAQNAYTVNEQITVASGPINIARNSITLTLPAGSDYFSVAPLPDYNSATVAATCADFANYAFAFVTGSQVSWSFNPASSTLTTTFSLTTTPMQGVETRAIQALYSHQWRNSSDINTSYEYDNTPRGPMKVMIGNSFTTTMTDYGVIPNLPYCGSYDFTTLYNYVDDVYKENSLWDAWVDDYGLGQRLQNLADIIPIAKQVGHYAAFNRFLDELSDTLQNCLSSPDGKNYRMAYYNSTWKTLALYPTSFDAARELNDHHFHYGYYVKAAAMVARYSSDADWTARDPSWITNWGPMVEMLIRDVNSWDRSDPLFPFLRYFDPYEGHDWASGHANFSTGNNEESSSEAMNFCSAVELWGAESGNSTIRDLGAYLRITTIATINEYWFNENNSSHPAGYSHQASGRIWGAGADYATWFGTSPEYVHWINWLPISGTSLYLGLPSSEVSANYTEMLTDNGGTINYSQSYFPDIVYAYQALYDPVTAKNNLSNLPANMNGSSSCCPYNYNASTFPYNPAQTLSVPMAYHWIHSLDSLGQVQAISADWPYTAVLYNGSCWHYIIYNPYSTGGPISSVKFSDGRTFTNVPADTLIYYTRCTAIMPVTYLDFTATRNNAEVDLKWITASEKDNLYFVIQRSSDGINFKDIGKIEGGGNNAGGQYSFIDHNPDPGNNFYRIKQVDVDGAFSYTKVIRLNFTSDSNITYYPNPANSELFINISSANTEEVRINLIDVLGRDVIKGKRFKLNGESNTLILNLEEIQTGSYILQIYSDEGAVMLNKKLIKN